MQINANIHCPHCGSRQTKQISVELTEQEQNAPQPVGVVRCSSIHRESCGEEFVIYGRCKGIELTTKAVLNPPSQEAQQ